MADELPRWDLTVAAEAIGWTSDEPPVIDDFTEEQHLAAIEALAPLLDRIFGLPQEIADDLAKDVLSTRIEDS